MHEKTGTRPEIRWVSGKSESYGVTIRSSSLMAHLPGSLKLNRTPTKYKSFIKTEPYLSGQQRFLRCKINHKKSAVRKCSRADHVGWAVRSSTNKGPCRSREIRAPRRATRPTAIGRRQRRQRA